MSFDWSLPVTAVIGGSEYGLNGDFRDILEIFSYFSDPDLPLYLQWQIALALFYDRPIPREHQRQAMEYLSEFISGGGRYSAQPGPRLLDWQQDGPLIVADINKVAGREIRALPFVHWWTFLSWFHGITQGQLSTVIAIRSKLARGKPLEDWEKTFYRENRALVELEKRYSRQEQEQRARLQSLLEAK